MKVTTKGQVTIPQEIREELGIHPGTEVDFTVEGSAVKLTRVKSAVSPGRALIDLMTGKGTVNMTTDEIMALTRGES